MLGGPCKTLSFSLHRLYKMVGKIFVYQFSGVHLWLISRYASFDHSVELSQLFCCMTYIKFMEQD